MKNNLLIIILFFGVVFFTFGKSLNYDYMKSWDDDIFILNNPVIHELSAENLKSIFTESQFGLMAPVLTLSLAIDYHFYQDQAWGYRLTNFILHALNMCLLFYIFRYFQDNRKNTAQQLLICGIIITTLWGIHPLRIESVVWLSQRRDVLSAFFCLLSFLLYLSSCRNANGSPEVSNTRLKRYSSIGFFILAAATKPSVVAFPVALVLLDLYPFQKFELKLEDWRKLLNSIFDKLEYFIVSLAFAALTILAHKDYNALHTLDVFPADQRATNAFYSLTLYIINTIAPVHLLPFYPRQELSFIHPLLLCLVGTVATAIYFFIKKSDKLTQSIAVVVFGSFVAMLLPALGILQAGNQGAGDRFTYLSTIPFYFCLAALILKYFSNKKLWICLGIWGALIFAKTIKQQDIWKDSVSLFTVICKETPFHLAFLHNYLGAASQAADDDDSAIMHYQDALSSDGQNDMWGVAALALGNIYNNRDSLDSANYYYEKAVQYIPDDPNIYCNMGIVYLKGAKYSKAIDYFRKAVELKSDYVKAIHNIGFCLLEMDKHDDAEVYFNEVLKIEPNYQLSQQMMARIQRERKEMTTQSVDSPQSEE